MGQEDYIKRINKQIKNLEDNHDIREIKNLEQNFYTDLNFNSLSLVELMMECEFEFKIQFQDEDLLGVTKVIDLIKKIQKYENLKK